ncbi:L-rhamnose mutarotase [candidate division KSB1 bacterium]|nr:L-rhamnose mutarotase [candidate division KSB1 bacterium]
MKHTYKRYCKTLELVDDPALIEEYKNLHSIGAAWPEITAGMKQVGIIDMEIYISGTTLFMIMDTVNDFDHDSAMIILARLPRQSEWEATVSKYQKTMPNSSAKEKWQLVDRIFKMDQTQIEHADDGYEEHCDFDKTM